jgi:hypothetical protein
LQERCQAIYPLLGEQVNSMFKHVVYKQSKFPDLSAKVFDPNLAYRGTTSLWEVNMESLSQVRVDIRQPIESPPRSL